VLTAPALFFATRKRAVPKSGFGKNHVEIPIAWTIIYAILIHEILEAAGLP
jgi:hypothetical protein